MLKKKATFGGCSYRKTSPSQKTLSAKTVAINFEISFEDALKLNLAIDECVRRLNSYNRSTTEGKETALCLTVHFDNKRITVDEL